MECTFKVGDKVRSFDFEDRNLIGERASYIEGTLEGFEFLAGCNRYVIRVEASVFGGKLDYKRVGTVVYPPVNGTPTLFAGVTDFVEPIQVS